MALQFTKSVLFDLKNSQPFLRKKTLLSDHGKCIARKELPILRINASRKSKQIPPRRIKRTRKKSKLVSNAQSEEKGPQVKCNVQALSWRERRISASILINAHVQRVWEVLTDYESLAEFIPNLVCSKIIPCPYPDRIWLLQRGVQRALYWHIEAQVVLDLQEKPDVDNDKELLFSMVDGDFKRYEGKWAMRPGHRVNTTVLDYEVSVIPRFNFPAIFVEKVIRSDLPLNLRALAVRAETEFALKLMSTDSYNMPAKIHQHISNASQRTNISGDALDSQRTSDKTNNDQSSSMVPKLMGNYIHHSSELQTHFGSVGKVCRLDRHCMVDEVHLRRLDDLLEHGGVHRKVIATVTIGVSSRKVWNALTAYERLPEFVPNLAISKVISRKNNKVRLLQEGCKGLLYMVLHARVILDLWEHHKHEIVFEQVEGDFDKFWGKWTIEQLGSQHTLLKYVVETKMNKNCLLAEAIVEEVIYEDLPSNLCAIRDYAEKDADHLNYSVTTSTDHTEGNQYHSERPIYSGRRSEAVMNVFSKRHAKQRPKVPGLRHDMEILKSELSKFIKDHGQEGFMPMRKLLRQHGRVDIEKAIYHMGGFRRVAALLNLSLSYKYRKPNGYWDKLENLKQEVNNFQHAWGMDPSHMPSRKTFERAGRFDLARAFEKWGGINEVARLLMLKVRHQRKAQDEDVEDTQQTSSSKGTSAETSHTNTSKDKWLVMPDELDPSWIN